MTAGEVYASRCVNGRAVLIGTPDQPRLWLATYQHQLVVCNDPDLTNQVHVEDFLRSVNPDVPVANVLALYNQFKARTRRRRRQLQTAALKATAQATKVA